MLQGVFSDNLGGIREPNGAGIQVLHLDYKIHIIQGLDDRHKEVIRVTHSLIVPFLTISDQGGAFR